LYYLGRTVLGLDEDTFWKCTPRKLDALLKVHAEIQNGEVEGEPEALTLTELLSWG
jgi:hypothetical protein